MILRTLLPAEGLGCARTAVQQQEGPRHAREQGHDERHLQEHEVVVARHVDVLAQGVEVSARHRHGQLQHVGEATNKGGGLR